MITPRCFIVRHGETEWSLSGKHTGTSDIPLTPNGEKRVRATGKALVGDDRLIVPKLLKHMYFSFTSFRLTRLLTSPSYVSPRTRAQRTLELLDIGCHDPFPWQSSNCTKDPHVNPDPSRHTDARVTITSDIAEWDYGDYEGITSAEIRKQRSQDGLGSWDIWRDGCPGGESPEQIIERVDRLIKEIRDKYHGPVIGKEKSEKNTGDVMVVAHGHILRAFAVRWIGRPLTDTHLIMEAGGVGTLSYEHYNLEEPAILLGGGFVVGDEK